MHKIKARIQNASENMEDSPTRFSGLKKALCSLAPSNSISDIIQTTRLLTHAQSKSWNSSNLVKAKNGPIFPTKDKENLPKINSGKWKLIIETRIWTF